MIDISTDRPLVVATAGEAPAYISVPVEQLEQVRSLLDNDDISYWVDRIAVSIEDGPEVTVVNLDRKVDPVRIQKILDDAT